MFFKIEMSKGVFRAWTRYSVLLTFFKNKQRRLAFLGRHTPAPKRFSQETFELSIVVILVFVARSPHLRYS